MNKDKSVFVVIVNYNGGSDIIKAIKSVHNSFYKNTSIIIIDNASGDNSVAVLEKTFTALYLVKNVKNKGFATAANQGARLALAHDADFVFFLNPDAIIEKETISTLIKACTRNKKHIASALIKTPNSKKVWFSHGSINWLMMRAVHTSKPVKDDAELYETQHAPGCALLCSQKFFKTVGFFDERFFLYYEDADICLRGAQKGMMTVVIPRAVAWHSEKSNKHPERKVYQLVLSGLIFFNKHSTGMHQLWIQIYTLLRRMKNKAHLLFFPHDAVAQSVAHAYRDYKFVKKTPRIHSSSHTL